MSQLTHLSVFNQKDHLVEGWYWLLKSSDLKKLQTKAVHFFGRDLVAYRGESEEVYALDAYCPHMGAHLADGKVEENSIRCFFHHWKYNSDGKCIDIPCQKNIPSIPEIKKWPVKEKYNLIWIWTGLTDPTALPCPPELINQEVDSILGNPFVKNCHPNVMMINAIDEQHFHSVHPRASELAGNLKLSSNVVNDYCIEFKNTGETPINTFFTKTIKSFYKGPLTYWMSYWFGSTGTVTLGPDFQHFHIIFALRPTMDGKSEGQTILVTQKRNGILGSILNFIILQITKFVGNYFAKGDTEVFKSIKFNLQTPLKSDRSIIDFIQHTEKQKNATHWREKN